MIIDDLKKILNDDEDFKKININCKFPKMNKNNINIFKSIIQKYKDINEDDILNLFINKNINNFICECGNIKHAKQNYCSKKCIYFKKYLKQRQEEGCLKKYGVKNVFQDKGIIQKITDKRVNKTKEEKQKIAEKQRQTKLNGIDENGLNGYQRTTKHSKETCMLKYNVDSYSKTQEYKDKMHKTYENKTNEEMNDILNKRKETCKQKYNVENVWQNKDIIEKIVNDAKNDIDKNGLNRYQRSSIKGIQTKKNTIDENGLNIFQKAAIKAAETCLKNNGYKFYFASKQFRQKMKIWNSQRHITNFDDLNEQYVKSHFISKGYFLVNDFLQYFNVTGNVVDSYKEKFNINLPNKRNNLKTQMQIYEFIKSNYNGNIIINNKKVISPLELDIYMPDLKLAIEFDGLLYHSFGKANNNRFNNYLNEDKNYHLNKTKLCLEKGIKLLHIFENEWYDKNSIWKSVILNHLHKVERIYARKCIIKEVNEQDKREFLLDNHLQGNCSSSINLGLYYNKQLVSIMTFGKSRFNKNYDWELLRFCNKINISVIGGASKLLKYFKKSYKGSLISYANRRWSDGNLYNKIGFKLIGETGSNYFYFKNDNILHNRLEFQKHKLKDKLEVFDENLSETENMYNNGYRKIYDCGNLIYTL